MALRIGTISARRGLVVIAMVVALGVALVPPGHAQVGGSLDTAATPLELALSIADDPGIVTGAVFEERTGGTPTARATLPLASFPLDGPDYAILTTGQALFAGTPNGSGSTGVNNGGRQRRGNTDFDVTVLRIDLQVPASVNCLVGLDFRFLSDEFPEFVGSSFNDAFIAELDRSTWTTSGSTIIAPDNFAFDPTGNPISINAAGVTSMTTAQAAGTTYDGATPILSAATPITPGPHSLYLSIFDQGDAIYDSAVFVDNLRVGRVADVSRDCQPGAVQRDPDQARPLLGAHGITGVPADMDGVLGFAESLVPSLRHTYSADTGRITSVWENGLQVWRDAVDITRESGQPTANVIAHSKGGLDSRVALWEHPRQFSALGMLATPNGGSKGANKLCGLRRAGIDGVERQFGPCDDDTDGLYNLQTSYMEGVFNQVVRDWPQHSLFVAAGDCTGLGRIKCNGATFYLLGCNNRGGDTAVCVTSAFERDIDRGGEHFGLSPVFDADHTQMRATPCPVSRMVGVLYGSRNVDNPWVGGDGSGCEGLTFATAATAGPAAEAPVALVDQRLVLQVARPGVPAVLRADPEGADEMVVEVLLPAGSTAQVAVTGPGGAVASGVVREDGELFGQQATTLRLTGLAGAPRTVTVTVEEPTEVGFATAVAPAGITATSSVSAVDARTGLVQVTLVGMRPSDQRRVRVQATVPSPDGPVAVQLQPAGPPSGREHTRVWAGRVPVTPGTLTPVDIAVTGPVARFLQDGVVTADGSATIGGLLGDGLVDGDGDGTLDSLAVDVAVTTTQAGEHQLAVDFVGADGVAFSAPGTATLDVGPGVIRVLAPLEALVAGGQDGPWEVRRAVLTRGTAARVKVAEADRLGVTGAYTLSTLSPDRAVLGRPTGEAVDTDGDGYLDALTFTSLAGLPAEGSYGVTGSLRAPDGAIIGAIDEIRDLPAGVTTLAVTFDAAEVIDRGPGPYVLADLTVTATGDATVSATAPAGVVQVGDVSRFVGAVPDPQTLVLRWRQAFADGEISQRGLYTSELNRLERVESLADEGDVDRAVEELDRFIAHLADRNPEHISADAAERLGTYAQAVRQELLGG